MRKMILAAAAFGAVMLAVACGGGGPSQSQECKDYVTCADKIGANAGAATIDSTYGAMGTCWTGAATQASADVCTSNCKTALPSLKTSFPDAGC